MTDKWQAGKTYPPGSLVVPSSNVPVVMPPIQNGDFETGNLTGWTVKSLPGNWSINNFAYRGTYCLHCVGGGIAVIVSDTRGQVEAGTQVSAQALANFHNNGTDDMGCALALYWYDASDTFMTQTEGTSLTGKGGSYKAFGVSGAAPAGAKFVRVAVGSNTGTHGGDMNIDNVSWSSNYAAPPTGLVYKATQANPGKSGASEPTWPGVTGVAVTDNEVTWEGVIATRLVWTAVPLLKSGGTEPVWPLDVGGMVRDNTINWTTISRRVEDKNCPPSKVVAIMASKVFAADKDIVRFSATVNPLDWTSEQNAGYLPTGLQQANANDMAVLAPYRSNLTAFNASSFQNWQVDPDPAAMNLLDQMEGIGSTWQHAAQPVGNDLFYLSQLGVRSVSIAAGTESLSAGDVGVPVDELVRDSIRISTANDTPVLATYYPSAGQYWLAVRALQPLAITGHLPGGVVGEVVSYQYTVSGGVLPRTVTLASGALPAGLSVSASGLVTGTRTTRGTSTWVVDVVDANGTHALLTDTSVTQPAEALTSKPKVTSWWDFENSLADQARGSNDQVGTVSYVANSSATGNMLAAGTVPLSTATSNGFNYYVAASQYSTFAFGARLSVSTLANVTKLLTVGSDSGSAVAGVVAIGINASGKWTATVYSATGTALASASSATSAVVDTDTHVGVNMLINGTNNQFELRINGATVATSATFNGTLSTNCGHFVIGTREGTGYQPKVSEMFWAHDSLTDAEWAYLYNSGAKRFFADFGSLRYGTTYDAYLASLMAAKSGGIYKLNDGSGTTAVDSATFGPIGSANLLSGATYSTASTPPPGFSTDAVVYLDGANDRVQTPPFAQADAVGPGVTSAMMWFKQSAVAAANNVYFDASKATQPWTGRISIMQGADDTKLYTRYNDFSGNTFPSGVASTPSRLNGWNMLSFAGFSTCYVAPVVNGIVMAAPIFYNGGNGGNPITATFGSYIDGTLGVQGYLSRSCICTTGNFSLPQLAKLYDLGMGIG